LGREQHEKNGVARHQATYANFSRFSTAITLPGPALATICFGETVAADQTAFSDAAFLRPRKLASDQPVG
jgi:hypothetical protein